jgi:hypothetical protein
LDRAWDNPHCHILELVAFGGVGKTSLVNKWLIGIAEKDFRGGTRVYAESFYSQGASEGGQASADTFIAAALKDFGDADPTVGSPWDKGRRLADLLRRERTLLILDGVEPLQYPTGEMKGHLKDPALQTLLKELAVANSGLVIVTTRLEVAELQGYTESRDPAKDPPVAVIDLENLTEEAGADLLEYLGVKGQRRELIEAARDFRSHALALTLLGKYLAVVHDGDIRQRDEIPALTEEEEKGGHARRVMKAYEIWLKDRPELLEILRIMGLFDRPADAGDMKAIRKNPAIEGLTSHLEKLPRDKWKYAIKPSGTSASWMPLTRTTPIPWTATPWFGSTSGSGCKPTIPNPGKQVTAACMNIINLLLRSSRKPWRNWLPCMLPWPTAAGQATTRRLWMRFTCGEFAEERNSSALQNLGPWPQTYRPW